jgi:hypothetical protein
MKIKQTQAIIFSGTIWFGIGLMLLAKGLNFIILGTGDSGKDTLAVGLVATSLLVGFFKGRFVLVKSAKRILARIASKPNPFPLSQLYPLSYYLIILSMVALGVSIRFLPIPVEVRGAIDVAIGSALMNGSLFYFREAIALSKKRQ